MIQHRMGVAALVSLLLALAACGGGSSNSQTEGSATVTSNGDPSGSRITLDAYNKDRHATAPKAVAPQDVLDAALAIALPPLQSNVYAPNGNFLLADRSIVFPALQAARIDVLREAAAGDTLAEIETALPPAATVDATRNLLDGVSRWLWAPATALFERNFLASTDSGGSAVVPWQAFQIQDWSAAVGSLAEFGAVSDLKLGPQTRLVIGQRFDLDASTNGQATAFTGVGVRAPDFWYTAPMVALEGAGGTLQGNDYAATATWLGDYMWVSIRPLGNEPLYHGLPTASLSSALLAVWSAYATPEGLISQSRQVWPQQSILLEDRSRLPAGIALPYSAVQANMSGLDGGGTYLTETARAASLTIDASGLRASGGQAMAFTFSADNVYGGIWYTGGSVDINLRITTVPNCPRAEPDWRGAYLVLIDRAGRILLVATLPDAAIATDCTSN